MSPDIKKEHSIEKTTLESENIFVTQDNIGTGGPLTQRQA